MKRLTALLIGILLGAAGMYCAFSAQVVHTGSEYLFVKKAHYSLDELFYADVSSWDAAEWAKHPTLQYDLISAGQGEVIKSPKAIELLESIFGTIKRQAESTPASRQ